jgi:hypothetical protein
MDIAAFIRANIAKHPKAMAKLGAPSGAGP